MVKPVYSTHIIYVWHFYDLRKIDPIIWQRFVGSGHKQELQNKLKKLSSSSQ